MSKILPDSTRPRTWWLLIILVVISSTIRPPCLPNSEKFCLCISFYIHSRLVSRVTKSFWNFCSTEVVAWVAVVRNLIYACVGSQCHRCSSKYGYTHFCNRDRNKSPKFFGSPSCFKTILISFFPYLLIITVENNLFHIFLWHLVWVAITVFARCLLAQITVLINFSKYTFLHLGILLVLL